MEEKTKILVTGAAGYIGKHVVDCLLAKGCDVIACDIDVSSVNENATKCKLDIFNLPEGNLFEYLGAPDVCLHMVWRNGFSHNASTQIGDLSAHYTFLTRLINDGLKHLAIMGSMHEVGYWEGAINETTPCNPMSLYGIAKDSLRRSMMFECKAHNVIFQWLRCYYILGDDMRNNSIFTKLLNAVAEGKKTFPFTSGKNKYDFTPVDELAEMITATILQSQYTGIINCCSGTPVSLGEKVEEFISSNNLDIKLDYGAFPDRAYDSPCVYGDASIIKRIMSQSVSK